MSTRTNTPTPSKQTKRKKQSEIKSIVHTFGSLILSWKNGVKQIYHLLLSLESLCTKLGCIRRATDPSGLLARTLPLAFSTDTSLVPVLAYKITEEQEFYYIQIKTFMRRLRDIVIAMTKLLDDGTKGVVNERADLFDAGVIFTVDHILEMQQIQHFYSFELDRKTAILNLLMSSNKNSAIASPSWALNESLQYDSNYCEEHYSLLEYRNGIEFPVAVNEGAYAVDPELFQKVISAWPDGSEPSGVATADDIVLGFLLKNNIANNEEASQDNARIPGGVKQ